MEAMKGIGTFEENRIVVELFSIDNDLVSYFRNLKGYSKKSDNTFTFANTVDTVEALMDKDIRIQGMHKNKLPKIKFSAPFDKVMYPFQKKGVLKMFKFKKKVLLADDMGLGKTIQTIAFLSTRKKHLPVLVMCPATLKWNWYDEFQKWWPKEISIHIMSGTKREAIPNVEVVIVNYDILHKRMSDIMAIEYSTVVLDECHYIKNIKAKRTKAAMFISKRIKNILALSGTPIENRPVEFFNVLNLLSPQKFPKLFPYAVRYCAAKRTRFGWDMSGSSHTLELNKILLDSLMIRRTKENVLKELPDKVISVVSMDVDNRNEYNEAEEDLVQWLMQESPEKAMKASKVEQLAKYNYLLQLSAQGKMNNVFNWVDDFLETGNKLVLFAHNKFVIQALYERYKEKAVKIDGSVSMNKRKEAVHSFQNNENVKLFIGNLKAAGVGITLTAANYVGILQFPFVPALVRQAIDRVHRITQNKKVFVYYFVAKNTMEEDILKILDNKIKILTQILDGKQVDVNDLVTELMKSLTERIRL
jgi:SWI/SNF-related matrix-associated actin-dependent regulator 1 of chromatin subfamily A